MDREAWRAAIHGVAKRQTRLSCWTELNWTTLIEGWERVAGTFKREGTCVHLGLIQVDVRQKWNQYFKAVIIPLKINKQKRILLRYVFLRKGMMVEFMTVEVAPGKWSRPDFQSSLYKASFLLLLFVVVFWSHFLNNLVYISANAGYFSVVCFSKARDPQLASFKGLDINTSKTHWQWVKTLIVYILCWKFFFFFLNLFLVTNTSSAIPYFSDFIIYILWLLMKRFNSKKLTYYIHVFNYIYTYTHIYSCCLVSQSCPTLCDPMDCSVSGFRVLYRLPELFQTHGHWVSDAI